MSGWDGKRWYVEADSRKWWFASVEEAEAFAEELNKEGLDPQLGHSGCFPVVVLLIVGGLGVWWWLSV